MRRFFELIKKAIVSLFTKETRTEENTMSVAEGAELVVTSAVVVATVLFAGFAPMYVVIWAACACALYAVVAGPFVYTCFNR